MTKPLAIVTGASSGVGLELAALCAREGFDLVVAADESEIEDAAERLRSMGADVTAVEVDLATADGLHELWHAIGGRDVDVLLANAERRLVGDFLDQDFEEVRYAIDTNVTGTVRLVQLVGRRMRHRGRGRILLAGSMSGFTPDEHPAVWSGTRAFIDAFASALRAELEDSGVTVTRLVSAETVRARRADALDPDAEDGSEEDDPAEVASRGFQAMMRGEPNVVGGWKNRLHVTSGRRGPASMQAERHRRMAGPASSEASRE